MLIWGFPGGSVVKNLPAMQETSSITGLGRSPGGGNGNQLQYSCLEKSHGQRSLEGYSPWVLKELEMTKQLSTHEGRQKTHRSVKDP